MGSGTSTQVKAICDDKTDANDAGKLPDVPVTVNSKGQTAKTTRGTKDAETSLKRTSSTLSTVKEIRAVPSPSQPVPSTSKSKPVMAFPSTAKTKPQRPAASKTELEMKLALLEKQLAESESEKLDFVDRIQALEERLQELTSAAAIPIGGDKGNGQRSHADQSSGELQETLKAKDHYIQQIEQQLATVQSDSTKIRVRLKKKIKNLTAQLTEAKQESSITHLELKDRNSQLQDKLRNSKDQTAKGAASPDGEEDDKESKFKVILDLSAEVSEQAEKIASLERLVKKKDKEIEELRHATLLSAQSAKQKKQSELSELSEQSQSQSDHRNSLKKCASQTSDSQGHNDRSGIFSGSGNRSKPSFTPVESGAYNDSSRQNSQQGQGPISKIGPRPSNPRRPSLELILERQSTALSDSDSDWEMEGLSSKIHSAPARVRVKSAAMAAGEKTRVNFDLDDKWSLATDDNDLMMTGEVRPTRGQSGRQKRRSALKTKQERVRNERARELMGPSLAFAQQDGEQLTDTSCNNTPTPRAMDKAFHFSSTDGMTFAV